MACGIAQSNSTFYFNMILNIEGFSPGFFTNSKLKEGWGWSLWRRINFEGVTERIFNMVISSLLNSTGHLRMNYVFTE